MSEVRGNSLARLARVVRRFAPLLRVQRRRLILVAVLMTGSIAAEILAPWPIQMVVDGVLLGRSGRGALRFLPTSWTQDASVLLAACACAIVVLAGLRGLLEYRRNLLAAAAGHDIVSNLRIAVFEKLQHLSLDFHQRHRTGDLLVRLTGDVSLLRELLVPAIVEISSRSLVLAGTLVLMTAMDPVLTLLAAATLPVLAIATVRFGTKLRDATRIQRRKEGRIAAVAGEALNSIAMIQAYSGASLVAARFSRNSAKSLKAGLRATRLEESLARSVELTLAVGSAVVVWFGARRVLAGSMSPGEIVVFLAYLRGIYRPVLSIVRTAAKAGKAAVSGERILEVLDAEEPRPDPADAVEAPPFRGEIVFENVTFGYSPERPVLHDVSFSIAPGERVALVGPSGSGKSTIVALLARLHEPTSGRILVDGTDIRSFTRVSYRRRIAMVLQEPFLLGMSIEDNVRFGRPEASAAEVTAAVRDAEAEAFVEELPDRYASLLGERGASLSRGQQQRIALARAIVRSAPILIFDEPTTGLDARTELEVVRTLAKAADGRTCLWIAHDLGQVLEGPRVLVLRGGRLVEDGAPTRLLANAGAFQTLFAGARP